MDDLISKQDAVNTSLEFFVEFLGGALHENAQKELITRFQRLPSAHPELDEWCTECKEYDHEKHNCPRYNRVIREAVEEIQENQIPENSAWFRISETLVDESKGDITAEQAVDKIRDYLKRMEKPERKKGKWINHQNDGYVDCPFCGALTTCSDGIEDLHFCFSCGAELEGEQE